MTKTYKVSVTHSTDYEYKNIRKAVEEGVNNLGGIRQWIKEGDRVLVKPNLFVAYSPEKVATTHPSVVKAIVEILKEARAKPIVGDAPGGSRLKKNVLDEIYEKTGIKSISEETGCDLLYDTTTVHIGIPEGKIIKGVDVIKVAREVDHIINVPKLKTHCLAYLTCASKNLFGLIPGVKKMDYHLKFSEKKDFFNMILDLNLAVKPALSIVDGVVGMEGNGPNTGNPRHIGVIITGDNTTAVDMIAAHLTGMKFEDIPTIRLAQERSIGPKTLNEIEIIKDVSISSLQFKLPSVSKRAFPEHIPDWMEGYILKFFVDYPVINSKNCIGCGICIESCPAKVIKKQKNNKVRVADYTRCIRCYCCHELCPHNAICLKKPLPAKISGKVFKLVRDARSS